MPWINIYECYLELNEPTHTLLMNLLAAAENKSTHRQMDKHTQWDVLKRFESELISKRSVL